MPVLDTNNVAKTTLAPGVDRRSLVDGTRGSQSITIAEVVLAPGARQPLHYHPTEEAIAILEGELEAVLGDEVLNVKAGQIVLAPPGVKHGFRNHSRARGKIYGIHPTNKPVINPVD